MSKRKNISNDHPHLKVLKSMWNLPNEMLNDILWENTNKNIKHEVIGLANEYIEYMTSIVETDNPSEAWEDWCKDNFIEHEIVNNPYLKYSK